MNKFIAIMKVLAINAVAIPMLAVAVIIDTFVCIIKGESLIEMLGEAQDEVKSMFRKQCEFIQNS